MAEPFLGEIRLFAFDKIPQGWEPCNGQILQIHTHPALYSILGTQFGGDGENTFALPNLQGRTPICMSGELKVGDSGGEKLHTLTEQEIPMHTHEVYGDLGTPTLSNPKDAVWVAGRLIYSSKANTSMRSDAISKSGGNQGHDNMQPYNVVLFCIAINGIFPSRI